MGTITKAPIGSQDINWKTSGTTRQVFNRTDSTGRTLVLNKPDAADLQFRTLVLSVDDLVDGGYDVEINPKSIHGGASNTTGHILPDVADDTFALLDNFSKGADVPSEAALFTISGFPTDGNYFDITGTTTITSVITSGRIGTEIGLHFDGILTLTDSADLVLIGGNIITAAGDEAIIREYAAGDWRLTNFSRASSLPVLLDTVQTIAGAKTFTDTPTVENGNPTFQLSETGVTADNGIWQLKANIEQFAFRLSNDAKDTFINILTVARTEMTVDTFNVLATELQHNGVNVYAAIDEDDMASNSAVRVPTQQSLVVYVATEIATAIAGLYGADIARTIGTSGSPQIYLAATDGFVNAWGERAASTFTLIGITDSANPPTLVKDKDSDDGSTAEFVGVRFPVRKGDYYQVQQSGGADSSGMIFTPMGS